LTQTLLMKRKSFIGTPYWMAPEVAAVERKGGYNHQCDIWAVGITAVELAETQPPMFDLHPMRALYLMTKRNFKSPGLTHKNKWSENFHDFLRHALQKDPKRRPTAAELLKHEYVARPELCSQLVLPLIKVLEASPPTPKLPVTEELEDDKDDDSEVRSSNQKKFRRVSSVKNRDLIHRQQSDAQMQQISLPVRDDSQTNVELLPAWLQSAAADPNYRPRIERLATDQQMKEAESEYIDPDKSPTTPPPGPIVPPLPPRQGGTRPQTRSPGGEAGNGVYGNVSHQPPLPPRASQRTTQPPPSTGGPPLPPRRNGPRRPDRRSGETNRKAYFSKIFNGCPLHLNCASSWTHPISKVKYVLFGAEEGLFSLLVTNNPDPVMEQVSSRPCHWVRVVENCMIWLSGRSNRIVSMTNLILLFRSESAQASLQHRSRQHTTKIADSKGCIKCCIARNPFTDQRYLIAIVPRGILLLQWFQPRHAFMHVMLFECQTLQPLNLLEAYVVENEEYPIVVLGVKESPDGTTLFDTLNLNSQASWYADQPDGKSLHVLCLQQLEKDTIFIGLERAAMFVGRNGQLKPSTIQASHITFDKVSEHMGKPLS
jgi:[mitogen-activated protein kinase] kinase 5